MKKFWLLLTIAFCCTTMFCACGGNDDDGPGDNSEVVGSWVGDDYDHFYSNVTITFQSDGTGSASIDHSGAFSSTRRAYFTYKVKGNKVTTKGTLASANSDGESDTQDFNNTYELSGNTLQVKNGNAWYTSIVKSYRKQ